VDRLSVDANVLFSTGYIEDAGARALWPREGVTLVTPWYAVEEVGRNREGREPRHRLRELLEYVEVVPVGTLPESALEGVDLPDKDRPIGAGAVLAGCTHLITGDFRHFGRCFGQHLAGVLVLPPGDYLRRACGGPRCADVHRPST